MQFEGRQQGAAGSFGSGTMDAPALQDAVDNHVAMRRPALGLQLFADLGGEFRLGRR
jgi:hypothetical protein